MEKQEERAIPECPNCHGKLVIDHIETNFSKCSYILRCSCINCTSPVSVTLELDQFVEFQGVSLNERRN